MTSDKTKGNFKKNAIIAILAIIAIGLISLIIYNKLNNKERKLELDNLSYRDSTFLNAISSNAIYSTGIVELQGYAEVVNRNIPDVPNDSFVFFHITNSSSSEFLFYLNRMVEKDLDGFFVRENAIGIGCLKDNKITMVRYADRYNDDELEFTLTEKDSKTITSSTKDNPVKIIIKKDLDTSVISDIPQCTTLITGVELVK